MVRINRVKIIVIKKIRQIALVVCMFFVMGNSAIGQETKQNLIFASSQEAEQEGCVITKLKDEFPSSCIMKETGDQMVTLVIYDGDKNGRYTRAEELCIPTYYWDASIKFLHIFKSSNATIEVKFTGAHGTGLGQKILMLVRWHHGKFVPILAETIEYHVNGMSEKQKMIVNYKYNNIRKDRPVVELFYSIQIKDIEQKKFKFKANWNDELTWNENNFSFYNERDEEKKLKMTPCFIQNNLKRIRLKIRDINLQQRCDDSFSDYFYDVSDLMGFDSDLDYCQDVMKSQHGN